MIVPKIQISGNKLDDYLKVSFIKLKYHTFNLNIEPSISQKFCTI